MNTADERTIAVWFKAMESVLFCLPPAVRLDVLHRLMTSEIERIERENEPIRLKSFADFDLATLENWHAVKEAASLIIQVLVRSITNNHSPDDSAKVLFREHRRGTGSGWLPDYLDGLPGITVDLKRCEVISNSGGRSLLTCVSSDTEEVE
jgi:hypothetical protein